MRVLSYLWKKTRFLKMACIFLVVAISYLRFEDLFNPLVGLALKELSLFKMQNSNTIFSDPSSK